MRTFRTGNRACYHVYESPYGKQIFTYYDIKYISSSNQFILCFCVQDGFMGIHFISYNRLHRLFYLHFLSRVFQVQTRLFQVFPNKYKISRMWQGNHERNKYFIFKRNLVPIFKIKFIKPNFITMSKCRIELCG